MPRSRKKNQKKRINRRLSRKIKKMDGGGFYGKSKLNYIEYDDDSPNKFTNLKIIKCIDGKKMECPGGSFGKIYLVEDRNSQTKMAMKILYSFLTSPKFIEIGNKGHSVLQKKINEESEDSEYKHENFYIIKLMAFGKIMKKKKGYFKLKAPNDVDSIKSIFENTSEKPFSIVEKAEGGDLVDFYIKIFKDDCEILDNDDCEILDNDDNSKISYFKLLDKYIDIFIPILIQVAVALKFIHEQDYIYFDLKPENIIFLKEVKIDGQGEISIPETRLIDFDFLKNKDEIDPNFNGGTKIFASPEVIHKLYPKTDRADVFSFGLLIYTSLILKNPPKKKFEPEKRDPYVDLQKVESVMKALVYSYTKELEKLEELEKSKENKLEKIVKLVKLVTDCVKITPNERPSMEQVLDDLKLLV
jgi:serine/threonine protein kinase